MAMGCEENRVSDCTVHFEGQLTAQPPDPNGAVDCAAWSFAYGLEFDSCGRIRTTGTWVRAHTDEPRPDRESPGLNLAQLAAVGRHLGVECEVHTGAPID